jgi:hypothetical protein
MNSRLMLNMLLKGSSSPLVSQDKALRRFWNFAHPNLNNLLGYERKHFFRRSKKDMLFQHVVVLTVMKAELPSFPKLYVLR